MQIITENLQEISQKINEAHKQVQQIANQSATLAIDAVRGAKEIGEVLNLIKEKFKSKNEYLIWCKNSLDSDIYEYWQEKYLLCAQLDLPLQINDEHTAIIRKGITLLDIVPQVVRETDGGGDTQPEAILIERRVMRSTELLCRNLAKVPKTDWGKYKVQLKMLYEVLKREVFADEN